jgi:YbgC/YbaW family acyl-CoA thioester hydrolase
MSSAPPSPKDFRFFERLRVRWAEVDMQRIVFNGHYLLYFDTAVAGWWRALGLPYHDTMAPLAGDFFVRKATLDYLGSARYDDQLEVGLRCQRIGTSSMLLQGAVFRGEQALVTGELVYVFADPAAQTPKPIPDSLRALYLGYEAGEAMFSTRTGAWADLGPDAQTLRTAVFVQEQNIPAELEWDAADATALHALVHNRLGLALGTGRLLQEAPGVGRIGRMAVRADMRGSRVGRLALDALVDAARARGDTQVMLHAQATAVAFYLRAGFVPRGPAFEEAGIPHQEMFKPL